MQAFAIVVFAAVLIPLDGEELVVVFDILELEPGPGIVGDGADTNREFVGNLILQVEL